MASRYWLLFGTALDAVLFFIGAALAEGSVEVARENSDSPAAIALAALFIALHVFCIACPAAAWRAHGRNRPAFHVALLFLSPIVYAAFLATFFVLV